MITTGQRTAAQTGSIGGQVAPSQPSRPSVQAITISGSASSAQPVRSSICLVEWGSGKNWAMKNCTKSG